MHPQEGAHKQHTPGSDISHDLLQNCEVSLLRSMDWQYDILGNSLKIRGIQGGNLKHTRFSREHRYNTDLYDEIFSTTESAGIVNHLETLY